MKIVKIETIQKQRRTVYDVDEMTLIKFGPEPAIASKLQNEDTDLIDFLEEEVENFEVEEEDETGYEITDTQWFDENDEI